MKNLKEIIDLVNNNIANPIDADTIKSAIYDVETRIHSLRDENISLKTNLVNLGVASKEKVFELTKDILELQTKIKDYKAKLDKQDEENRIIEKYPFNPTIQACVNNKTGETICPICIRKVPLVFSPVFKTPQTKWSTSLWTCKICEHEIRLAHASKPTVTPPKRHER